MKKKNGELEKKKKLQINSVNISKKNLMNEKFKKNLISMNVNDIKKKSNYLKYNDIIYNTQSRTPINNNYNSFNKMLPINNSTIINIKTNNNSNLKYLQNTNQLNSESNQSSSRLKLHKLHSNLNLNKINNYNNYNNLVGIKNNNEKNHIYISNKIKKTKKKYLI